MGLQSTFPRQVYQTYRYTVSTALQQACMDNTHVHICGSLLHWCACGALAQTALSPVMCCRLMLKAMRVSLP